MTTQQAKRHPKCLGFRDYFGEFDCEYQSILICEECKYSGLPGARKDPAAKCNQPRDYTLWRTTKK